MTNPTAETSAVPSLDRAELAANVASGRHSSVLDLYREAIPRKLRGVSEEDARRRLVPSMTTLGGLVKHLRWVEQGWFQRGLAGRPAGELAQPPWALTTELRSRSRRRRGN